MVLGGPALASSAATARPAQPSSNHTPAIRHVLLISVDGMHQSDLEWYVAQYPHSELARLAAGGAEYTRAQTPDPSDSDLAGPGLMTGGNPGDRDVPLIVYAPGIVRPGQSGLRVETTQVAPTILKLLGLNPGNLQAVRIEHTRVLPGVQG